MERGTGTGPRLERSFSGVDYFTGRGSKQLRIIRPRGVWGIAGAVVGHTKARCPPFSFFALGRSFWMRHELAFRFSFFPSDARMRVCVSLVFFWLYLHILY